MDHARLCAAAADAVDRIPAAHRPPVMVGFDGFIDAIIDVVATRQSSTAYRPMATISEFGQRVSAAAGHSANFELVVKQRKIGGNGPIMANALCALDHAVDAVGLLGEGAIDPVFAPLAQRARAAISLGEAASTDALEFSDGKLMLGKLKPMDEVTWERLVQRVGRDRLRALLQEAKAVATVNWTMTLGMNGIWRGLCEEILPGLRGDRPLWFVDLADPAKRTIEDQRAMFDGLRALQRHVDVVLGMNGAECKQMLAALDASWDERIDELDAAQRGCEIVREKLGIAWAMCHLVKSAACAWRTRGGEGSAQAQGFFEPKPLITTGAGDHFNAGFVAALLAGIEPRLALQIGNATSGHYVRTAQSPSRAQLATFLRGYARSDAASTTR